MRLVCSAQLLLCAFLLPTLGCNSASSRLSDRDFTLPQVRGGTFRLHSPPGHAVLLAFLQAVPDTAATPSRSEAVCLMSMARQYGPRGLTVVIVDSSALVSHRPPDHDALLNASYDWQLNIPLLEDQQNRMARRFGVTQVPTLILLRADGRVFQRRQGLTSPAQLAQLIEKLVGGPLGQAPSL